MGNSDFVPFRIRPDFVGSNFSTYKPPGKLHRINYLDIAGAAAEISPQRLFNFFRSRIIVLVQQRFGGHNHAGSAKTALNGPGKGKCFLYQVGVIRCAQTFNGNNIGTVKLSHFK